MKKLVLLLGLCLLLAGCNPRSRQPSENYVPPGDPAPAAQGQTAGDPAEDPLKPGGEDWTAPSGGIVKEVFFQEGDYKYEGSTIHYSYAIPMVDLPSDFAMGCNQEIELRFGNPIRDSIADMERFEPLVVQTVRYTEDIFGSVLTVRIYRTDVNGEERQGIYSLNAVTGDEPAYEEYLAAAGLQENLVSGLLNDAVTLRFRELASGRFRESDVRYSGALTQTLNGLGNPERLPKHLTEDGRLAFYVTVYDPEGGSDLQEILLP